MRRAMLFLILIASIASLWSAPSMGAKMVNAIGLIDYSSTKHTFKPGDWVRYRVIGENNEGAVDDYFVTILIAGEERFWGEDCFWVETRTQSVGIAGASAVATLMSYSVFGDSLANLRMKYYMRKSINDMTEDGTFRQDLVKRPPLTLKNRQPPEQRITWDIDTVGVDTVNTPMGLFQCTKVKREEGIAATADKVDSSSRSEMRDARTVYYAEGVPITRFAREHILNTIRRSSWPIGRSSEGEMRLIALSEGNARLIDFGTGLESNMVPKKFQKSLREQAAATSRPAPKPPRAKRPS